MAGKSARTSKVVVMQRRIACRVLLLAWWKAKKEKATPLSSVWTGVPAFMHVYG
jgi:hypothetical protein